jgi:hypothetical protein
MVCSICLEEIQTPQVRNYNCSHVEFHAECIERWAVYANTCPLCRIVAVPPPLPPPPAPPPPHYSTEQLVAHLVAVVSNGRENLGENLRAVHSPLDLNLARYRPIESNWFNTISTGTYILMSRSDMDSISRAEVERTVDGWRFRYPQSACVFSETGLASIESRYVLIAAVDE